VEVGGWRLEIEKQCEGGLRKIPLDRIVEKQFGLEASGNSWRFDRSHLLLFQAAISL
jgi:hypothetical protein